MPNYHEIQVIGYGSVTSTPTQVLPDTTVNDFKADALARANTLCAVADWAKKTFDAKLGGSEVLKIFIAPEFYFRYGGPSQPPETLGDSYPNGDALLPEISEKVLLPFFASPRYADWLIVAGTMFWHRSAQQSDSVGYPTYFNTVLAIRGGPSATLSAEERSMNGQRCQVPTMTGMSTNQKKLMSWVDYAPFDDRRLWDAALNPMFRPILYDWDWWRWHAFKVHDADGPTGKPIVFGLEVCLEHAEATPGSKLGVLRMIQQQYGSHCPGPVPQIDVHLVTSCGMTLQPNVGVAARVNGIATICDGAQPPGGTTWPNANSARVISIGMDGTHNTVPDGWPMATQDLPDDLQVGVPGQRHTPEDAVSVGYPMQLIP
jgi:hypothetical protein